MDSDEIDFMLGFHIQHKGVCPNCNQFISALSDDPDQKTFPCPKCAFTTVFQDKMTWQ